MARATWASTLLTSSGIRPTAPSSDGILLVMVVYMLGYASGSVATDGALAAAATFVKVLGMVSMVFLIVKIIDIVTLASTTTTTTGTAS